ncbi:hypothetical protein K431DRAFT_297405 [Polychaeton citri CBS 116435]|uniref:Survival Motor Neuron Gemin2-binding domain-containing protein n=1 Tax=Polychaeton citri CBS 116435 TaxID=1314669 RepID=A0A9P4UJG0_9PEZI|nr:hypothetical protein K431DRAFT_297405 [Polychaeton citri CBS 116435]
MGKKNLSHAQIWDDSALVDSWNQAFEEYKKYHSIATRGGELDLESLENIASEDAMRSSKTGATAVALTDAEAVEPDAETVPDATPAAHQTETAQSAATEPSSQTNGQVQDTNGMAVPVALLNSMQDEGMKNLMMSWYYAGYYTGLYEGKQQALANFQQGG